MVERYRIWGSSRVLLYEMGVGLAECYKTWSPGWVLLCKGASSAKCSLPHVGCTFPSIATGSAGMATPHSRIAIRALCHGVGPDGLYASAKSCSFFVASLIHFPVLICEEDYPTTRAQLVWKFYSASSSAQSRTCLSQELTSTGSSS